MKKSCDDFLVRRILLHQQFFAGGLVIRKLEAGGHGGAKEGKPAACCKSRTLPGIGWRNKLRHFAAQNMLAHPDNFDVAIGQNLQLINPITQIKMPDFIGGQAVHGRKTFGRYQIINAGTQAVWRRIPLRETRSFKKIGRFVGFAVVSSFAFQRNEVECLDNIFCLHNKL